MRLASDVFNTEPYFTSSQGIKFWDDENVNDYLKECKLYGYQAWLTEDTEGVKERILVCSGRVIYATQQWESMLSHIDFMRLANDFER
jgi:hypothetical protein